MAKQLGLYAQEDRYQRVFSAGAVHWNDPQPNAQLARALEQPAPRSHCIELGCGEGYQARFMASRGHGVTGIDLSPTAIAKAVRQTPTSLEGQDRRAHLELIHRLLVPGGRLFLHNALDLDDERAQLERMKQYRGKPAGYPVENTIVTESGERKMMIPLRPACTMLSVEGYGRELAANGFRVLCAEREGGVNYACEAIVVAERL